MPHESAAFLRFEKKRAKQKGIKNPTPVFLNYNPENALRAVLALECFERPRSPKHSLHISPRATVNCGGVDHRRLDVHQIVISKESNGFLAEQVHGWGDILWEGGDETDGPVGGTLQGISVDLAILGIGDSGGDTEPKPLADEFP